MAKKTQQAARQRVLKTYKLYINGGFPRTESGRAMLATNPQGDFVANLCRASRKDFRNAVVAARAAQRGWASRTAFLRGQIIYRMAEVLESRRALFIEALREVAGYSQDAATQEVDASIDRLVWYAGWSDKLFQLFGTTNPVASPHFNVTSPEPTGVVAIIAPERAPLLGLISTLAPVIVSGNVAVMLVENSAPSIAIELAEVFHCSDLPSGVVNILTGLRDELMKPISSHMDVDAVLCASGTLDQRKMLAVEGAEAVKRVHFWDELDADAAWSAADMQSPYWIMRFVEFKTSWHPMGV